MRWLIIVLLVTSCAQPLPPPTQVTTMDSRIGTGVTTAVDYINDGSRCLVTLTLNNMGAKRLQIWMNVKHELEFSETIKRMRIHLGDDLHVEKTFRLEIPEKGVSETITFEVYDIKGEPVMKTEPIVNLL